MLTIERLNVDNWRDQLTLIARLASRAVHEASVACTDRTTDVALYKTIISTITTTITITITYICVDLAIR